MNAQVRNAFLQDFAAVQSRYLLANYSSVIEQQNITNANVTTTSIGVRITPTSSPQPQSNDASTLSLFWVFSWIVWFLS
jgi:hypothetical protein